MSRLYLFFQLIVLSALLLTSSILPAQPPRGWTTITNGSLWLTSDGDTVQAHAPGIIYEQGRWWMVGEDRSREYRPDVNLYSSTDLQHWCFEKKSLKTVSPPRNLGTRA